MRKPIIAAALMACSLAWAQSFAQEAERVRPSQAPSARVQVVPAGCQSVLVSGLRVASVDLYDLSMQRVGAAGRRELANVRTALLCNSEPGYARIETADGVRLVRRALLMLQVEEPGATRGINAPDRPFRPLPDVVDDAEPPRRVEREVRPPSPPPPSTGSGAAVRQQPSIVAPTRPQIETQTQSETRSAQVRVLTPVLVELMSNQAREARNGGSAVAVLADPVSRVGANKNLLLCRGLYLSFDQASAEEAAIGVRIGAEGEVEQLRPIYWLAQSPTDAASGADRCPQRVANFDYPRSYRIARKLGLTGAGPYLVVERHDLFETERVAAVIDLSRTPPDQIIQAVRYFRDGFMQAGDVWAPQRFVRTRARNDVVAFMDQPSTEFSFVPRLVRAARHVGCPLTNLLDVCTAPG